MGALATQAKELNQLESKLWVASGFTTASSIVLAAGLSWLKLKAACKLQEAELAAVEMRIGRQLANEVIEINMELEASAAPFATKQFQ